MTDRTFQEIYSMLHIATRLTNAVSYIFVMTAQFWVRIYSNGHRGGANKVIFSFFDCLWMKDVKEFLKLDKETMRYENK